MQWENAGFHQVVMGKWGRYMEESGIRAFSNTVYRTTLQMHEGPECKTRCCETPGET